MRARRRGPSTRSPLGSARSAACSACSGSTADDPAWQRAPEPTSRLDDVVDGLVAALLEQRAGRPAAQGLRHRRRPPRPAHRLGRRGRRHPARSALVAIGPPQVRSLMPGNSQRKGAVRRKGKGNTAGSGGRVRRGLEGRGPTPKAEDRPYHVAHKAKAARQRCRRRTAGSRQRTGRPGAGPEWVVGRNPVLEAMEAEIPVKTAYVAEGAERDDRLREMLKLAADRSTPMLRGHPRRAGPDDRRRDPPGRRAAAARVQLRAPRRPAGRGPRPPTPSRWSSRSTRSPTRATSVPSSAPRPPSARTAC